MLRKLKMRSESDQDQDTVTSYQRILPSKISLATVQGNLGSASSSISSVEDLLNESPIPRLPPCDDTTLDGKVVIIEAPALKGLHSSIGNIHILPRQSTSTKRKFSSDPLGQQDLLSPSNVSIVSVERPLVSKKPRPAPLFDANYLEQPISLLADPEDEYHLNKLHCFVRKNIEWFVATAADIAVPSPGRKTALRVGQIGLRCIHCRHVYSRDRTKRAICYPTSVSRIYHCVSDMKFDHFPNCQFLPEEERNTFNDLKSSRRSGKKGSRGKHGSLNGNTAHYYYRTADRLGMQDSKGFVSLQNISSSNPKPARLVVPSHLSSHYFQPVRRDGGNQTFSLPTLNTSAPCQIQPYSVAPSKAETIVQISPPVSSIDLCPTASSFTSTISPRLLAAPEDESVLNPIHCFVRKNVEVFAATETDITAPAPGRKNRVTLGQVGIRCIHCSKIPSKERVKRAICYPPSITSIYHSVSNMKFDHFGACRGLPPSARQEFAALRTSTGKRGAKRTGCNRNGSTTNSTSQYYRQSAITRLGLVDTNAGIRIRNDAFQNQERTNSCSSNENQGYSPTDGMSVLMMAATDPDIRKLYENRKARYHA